LMCLVAFSGLFFGAQDKESVVCLKIQHFSRLAPTDRQITNF
jgi:hypothetical protein